MSNEQEQTRDDLTARARIRDAALDAFAEHGISATTIRGVAQRAEVSPALVQHHFGTKAGLRAACDSYVTAFVRTAVEQALDQGRADEPRFVSDLFRGAPRRMRYLARTLVDRTPAATEVFDSLVTVTENYLRQRTGDADVRLKAVVLTSMRLGVTILSDHMSRNLQADIYEPELTSRVGTTILDLLSPDLFPEGEATRIGNALQTDP